MKKLLCRSLAVIVLVAGDRADGADSALTAAAPAVATFEWTGFYAGGHVSYRQGHTDATFWDPVATRSGASFGNVQGGVQAGYNHLLPSHILLGAEADISFPNYLGADDVTWSGTTARGNITERIDYVGTLRGRFGYAFANWLIYGTGGFAWSQGRFLQQAPGSNDPSEADKVLGMRTGWVAGAGVETAFERNWTARLEYLYSPFGTSNVVFPSESRYASTMDLHTLRLGLNRKFDWPQSDGRTSGAAPLSTTPGLVDWEIHGQTTYIQQGYPRFRSPYFGTNSLTPWPQTRETLSVSAFVGVRLWDGGELYYNPELIQGYGLNATFGAAGFPNGEAQKSNFSYPHYITSRLFLRQTFGLGGEQETIESDYGQMAGKRDISRLTFQVGKFAIHDMFDNNSYAADSRTQFMNWSIWAAGAFDYPGDMVGLTYGAVAELNQKQWALRGGYFLVVKEPNTNNFDMELFRRGGYVAELESRYSLFARSGKLRIIAWMHDTFSGGYRDAVNMTSVVPGLDPTDAIVLSRTGRIKYGYVFNVEQAISDDVGVFGRWSWNNGKNEISAFTDIDASLSFGASIKGSSWGRPNDVIGIGGAVNAISKDHRDYLAAGGMGILIGDGRLNYQQEKVLEAYYALSLLNSTTLTFDYQILGNPAYNADRGPISIFAARLHAQF